MRIRARAKWSLCLGKRVLSQSHHHLRVPFTKPQLPSPPFSSISREPQAQSKHNKYIPPAQHSSPPSPPASIHSPQHLATKFISPAPVHQPKAQAQAQAQVPISTTSPPSTRITESRGRDQEEEASQDFTNKAEACSHQAPKEEEAQSLSHHRLKANYSDREEESTSSKPALPSLPHTRIQQESGRRSMEVESRYVAIRHHVEGFPSEADFEVKAAKVRWAPDSGEVLVRNLYVSVDPYQLNRMKRSSASHLAVDGIVPGERIAAYGAGEVLASASAEYKEGDVVAGVLAWEDYTLFRPAPGMLMSKIDTSGFPLYYHLSVLGTSGMTAYGGFYEVCNPKEGEKVFVSAASGSVGSLVGQFAKLAGCYVVGCAGSKAKVDLLKDKLGFDDAFNYKEEPDLKSALKRYFPDGIDIYFENVGGEMLEAALANMNMYGRVALCGVISEYTGTGKRAVPDLLEMIYKRITIRGFLAWDFVTRFDEFVGIIGDWIRQGKIKAINDISDGLDSVPSAFTALFRGKNIGKKIVKLTE